MFVRLSERAVRGGGLVDAGGACPIVSAAVSERHCSPVRLVTVASFVSHPFAVLAVESALLPLPPTLEPAVRACAVRVRSGWRRAVGWMRL